MSSALASRSIPAMTIGGQALEYWVAQLATVPGREDMPTQLQQLREDM